jgi:spermidine synthase
VGILYALNAAGSMAGALAVTFILTAFFGSRAILTGCSALLILTGGILLPSGRPAATADATHQKAEPKQDVRAAWDLRAFVFVCGILVMGLEVVGGAQMAPYLGSTVMVWGSLICVFLSAMTMGYRIGGVVAQWYPSAGLLALLVAVAGFWLMIVPFMAPGLGNGAQSLATGGFLDWIVPLPVAFILYFVPVTAFAVVAPVAVRLAAGPSDETGSAAGGLYALSTTGNVMGLLLATFVLLPRLGATGLITAAGIASIFAGLFFYYRQKSVAGSGRIKAAWAFMLTVTAVLVFLPKPEPIPLADAGEEIVGTMNGWHVIRLQNHPDYAVLRRIRYKTESPYQHVAVIDEKQFPVGKPVALDDGRLFPATFTTAFGNERVLRFDRYIQSAVMLNEDGETIRQPFRSGLAYTDTVHVPMLMNPAIRDVLVIGGGGGVLATVLKSVYPVVVDVVEIDPVVVSVAAQWFGLEADERLRVYAEDGRTFVRRTQKRYDYIFLDAYSTGGRIPFHLTTREFMEDVKTRLSPTGIVFMNIISAVEGPRSRPFRSILKTIRHVFGTEAVFVLPVFLNGHVSPADTCNILVGAVGPGYGDRPLQIDVRRVFSASAPAVRDAARSAMIHGERLRTPEDLAAVRQYDVPVLTDDYAPINNLTVPLGEGN